MITTNEIAYDPELEEMLEDAAFEEEHPCAVRRCTSPPHQVSEMDDDYYTTVCFFGHETVWTKENNEPNTPDDL